MLTNPRPLTADTVRPSHYRRYRLHRFGRAGTQGGAGVYRAAFRHGVKVRAWLYYESGDRTPSLTVRRAVARWLNREARGPLVLVSTRT